MKKLLAIILAVCLTVTLLPAVSIADTDTETPACQLDGVPYNSLAQAAYHIVHNAEQKLVVLRDSYETESIVFKILYPTLTIDLNGHKVVGNGSDPVFVIDSSNLTIIDSSKDKTGCITQPAGSTGPEKGGGLFITGGNVHFSSGTITGCNAKKGGGIYGAYYFYLEGGTITNCSAEQGGGIYTESLFYCGGGTITNCSAEEGGGLYMCYREVDFYGNPTITGNSATKEGGGVCTTQATKVNFTKYKASDETIPDNINIYGNTVNGKENNFFMKEARRLSNIRLTVPSEFIRKPKERSVTVSDNGKSRPLFMWAVK